MRARGPSLRRTLRLGEASAALHLTVHSGKAIPDPPDRRGAVDDLPLHLGNIGLVAGNPLVDSVNKHVGSKMPVSFKVRPLHLIRQPGRSLLLPLFKPVQLCKQCLESGVGLLGPESSTRLSLSLMLHTGAHSHDLHCSAVTGKHCSGESLAGPPSDDLLPLDLRVRPLLLLSHHSKISTVPLMGAAQLLIRQECQRPARQSVPHSRVALRHGHGVVQVRLQLPCPIGKLAVHPRIRRRQRRHL